MRVLLLLVLLSSFACKVLKKRTTSNYYFPAERYLNEKTLYYVNELDTMEKAYWKVKTNIYNGDTVLHSAIFNNNKLTENISERLKGGQASITSYILYNGDQARTCIVIDSAVYNVNQVPNERIQWKVKFQDFNSNDTVSLEKIRQLQRTDGKRQVFLDRMKVHILGSGSNYEYAVESVYEHGTGLTSYRITRPDGHIRHYKLVEVK